MSPVIAVQVRIEGKVQGVWFRAWTMQEATALGLSGWVRNRRDRSVEALFAGDAGAVSEMVARCHVGPPAAVVSAVHESAAEPPDSAGFVQLPTV